MAMTVEERRAKDAKRKRAERAKAREEREGREREARTVDASKAAHTMRDAVQDSLDHMRWLKPSDNASVAQAKELARLIDELEFAGETVRMLSAHRALSKVLYDLGGTPVVRMQRELRNARTPVEGAGGEGGKSAGEDKGGGKSSPGGGIVTEFKRPRPRSR